MQIAPKPADVAEPVERRAEALKLRNMADARGYAIRFSVGHAACDSAPSRGGRPARIGRSPYEHKHRGTTAGA
ncbi:hypothetical protein [Burkholderia sp. JP2-270]|uniref:hypothetical protein n=1 Tax=Burkholderia sp. JP2-270 TaxID=2217913 RepID=UPI001EF8E97A|nr:hypothetical protein [Burkholderia sp. JP2-270]